MAFTETYLQPQRWSEFAFFVSGGADGAIVESVAPGVPFRLGELGVHCSVAFASVEDLTVRLSAVQGSAHNMMFVSYAINGSTDVLLQYFPEIIFQSDDQLRIALSLASGVNVIGITVKGWAVLG